MGIVSKIKHLVGKKEEPKTEISEGIEAQREHFRQSANVQAMMEFEKKDFFTKGNYQDE